MRWTILMMLSSLLLGPLLGCGTSYKTAASNDVVDRPDRFPAVIHRFVSAHQVSLEWVRSSWLCAPLVVLEYLAVFASPLRTATRPPEKCRSPLAGSARKEIAPGVFARYDRRDASCWPNDRASVSRRGVGGISAAGGGCETIDRL